MWCNFNYFVWFQFFINDVLYNPIKFDMWKRLFLAVSWKKDKVKCAQFLGYGNASYAVHIICSLCSTHLLVWVLRQRKLVVLQILFKCVRGIISFASSANAAESQPILVQGHVKKIQDGSALNWSSKYQRHNAHSGTVGSLQLSYAAAPQLIALDQQLSSF